MQDHAEECARLARILAQLESAGAAPADVDPTAAVPPEDLEWAAAHLDGCARCALADDAVTPSLLEALRTGARDEIPDEAFFAARRAAVMTAIAAVDHDQSTAAQPRRAPAAAHAARRTAAVDGAHRRRWLPAAVALAAAMVLVVATALLRTESARVAVVAAPPATGFAEAVVAIDPAELADADDAWIVADSGALAVERSSARGRALDDLSDTELDEIEGVFVSVPGWS